MPHIPYQPRPIPGRFEPGMKAPLTTGESPPDLFDLDLPQAPKASNRPAKAPGGPVDVLDVVMPSEPPQGNKPSVPAPRRRERASVPQRSMLGTLSIAKHHIDPQKIARALMGGRRHR